MLLVTTWFGSFLVDGHRVVRHSLFPKDPEAIAERLHRIEDWKALDEERRLVAGLDEFFVTEPRLERIGGRSTPERVEWIRPEDYGFDRRLLHEAMLALGRRRMREAVRPDDHLAQAVATLDDLLGTENLLVERLREWYGLHFPELARLVDSRTYVAWIAEHADRSQMPLEERESVGAPITEAQRERLERLARTAREVAEERERLEGFIESTARELAPNVSRLVGPVLCARLIALAGGLRELARLPAGTVQLLGAERALFRHIREGKRPPKHGVLFQHPLVHGSPRWQRGPITRALAGKIAIAARADVYTKRDVTDGLQAKIDAAVEEIRRTHAAPKPRAAARRPRARRKRGRQR